MEDQDILVAKLLSFVIASEKVEDLNRLEAKRLDMVANQIEARGIKGKALLQAMREIPRHLFVPEVYTEMAYRDGPLPIACGQTISQPYIVAYMIEKAKIKPTDRVLEIGTGSGYNAAVLSLLCQEVYTVEIIGKLSNQATQLFKQLGYKNIQVKIGDGAWGWEEKAPFDVILLTAAPEQVPQALLKQLKEGGRLVLPVGPIMQQRLIKIVKTPTGIEREVLSSVRFVPMQHRNSN